MKVFTIGFTQKTAEEFFRLLRDAGVRRLVDIRLNNSSQLAGFAKRDDLVYFLRELCCIEYLHEPLLTPTQEILDEVRKRKGSWEAYERAFLELMGERHVETALSPDLFAIPTALLCSEATPEHCHRRLVLEYLAERWGDIEAVHL